MIAKFKSFIQSIPRAAGVSDRVVVLGLGGRFYDELLSGLPAVLTPTFRAAFGLSYTQLSLLSLALSYVAAGVEPVAALLVDVWRRRWLMAWGAAGIGLATVVMGLAPSYLLLLIGFAIYGLASGPLAHTADVVLVEAYPQAPDRIFTRATLLDTLGALLAPLSISIAFWLGLEWRWLLVALGLSSVVYAALIWRTRFPPHANGREESEESLPQAMIQNLRAVLQDRRALTWLAYLFVFELLETPGYFVPVWLHEQVGMSQSLVGLYQAVGMAVGMVSLVYLDRWLQRSSAYRILQIANVSLLLLYPAWLLVPGVWTRFALEIPISFLVSVYWPIGRGQSLASVPGKAGAVTAVTSLFGLVPFSLLFGLLAEAIGLTAAMLLVHLTMTPLLILLVMKLPRPVVADTTGDELAAEEPVQQLV
jgi:FSR family fosmidomycin resistance protein-like MFS transporter